MNFGKPTYKYWEGFTAVAYLGEVPEIESRLKPVLDQYTDIMTKAVFAKSDTEAKQILDSYRDALKKSGLDDYKAFLQKKRSADPKSVVFYIDATF
jgi:putative aldouronate transport system substrate-binding protein